MADGVRFDAPGGCALRKAQPTGPPLLERGVATAMFGVLGSDHVLQAAPKAANKSKVQLTHKNGAAGKSVVVAESTRKRR
jgi:hypothetical protein